MNYVNMSQCGLSRYSAAVTTSHHYHFCWTTRFHVAENLFRNTCRSQMTSKCGKDKKVSHKSQLSMSLMFLPHFDILDVIYHCYHPLQHRIYLLYTIKRQNVANGEVIYVTVLQQILSKNQSNCMYNSAYHKNHNFLNCRWF